MLTFRRNYRLHLQGWSPEDDSRLEDEYSMIFQNLVSRLRMSLISARAQNNIVKFTAVPPDEYRVSTLKLGHDRFLSNPLVRSLNLFVRSFARGFVSVFTSVHLCENTSYK
jgi:hypothetical protein